MAQTIFFAVLALLFVMAYAGPTQVENQDVSPDDIINALDMGIITSFHTVLTLETLLTNLSSIDFNVKNPLSIELTIKSVSVAAGLNGTEYIAFNQTFEEPGFVIPSLGTNNTGTINNALFVQGAINSLDIFPVGVLDVLDMNVSVCAASPLNGETGICLEVDDLKEGGVPATYDLELGA